MTLKIKRAPLLSNIKLFASFHHHIWIQTGVTVRKWLSWVVTSVTFTFDLWPWPFAWTLLWSLVISLKIVWWYNDGNIVKKVWQTDGQTDRQTDRNTIQGAAWSQLKRLMPDRWTDGWTLDGSSLHKHHYVSSGAKNLCNNECAWCFDHHTPWFQNYCQWDLTRHTCHKCSTVMARQLIIWMRLCLSCRPQYWTHALEPIQTSQSIITSKHDWWDPNFKP